MLTFNSESEERYKQFMKLCIYDIPYLLRTC